MFEKSFSLGFDLYQPFQDTDWWVFDYRNGQAFYGSFKEIITFMIKELDFDSLEIDDAISCLFQEKNHNGCHFGMYKKFIFSFKKEVVWDKAS